MPVWILFSCTVLCWGTYEILDNFALKKVNAETATIYKLIFNVVTFPILFWVFWKKGLLTWNIQAFLLLIVSCLFTSVADYTLLSLLKIKDFGWVISSTVSVSTAIAVILGIVLFKEPLTLKSAAGFLVILVGIYLIS